MVAGHGQIIGKDIVLPRLADSLPATAGHFVNPPPYLSDGQIILVFTGHLAGFAPRA
jgi:hypothetical protein